RGHPCPKRGVGLPLFSVVQLEDGGSPSMMMVVVVAMLRSRGARGSRHNQRCSQGDSQDLRRMHLFFLSLSRCFLASVPSSSQAILKGSLARRHLRVVAGGMAEPPPTETLGKETSTQSPRPRSPSERWSVAPCNSAMRAAIERPTPLPS